MIDKKADTQFWLNLAKDEKEDLFIICKQIYGTTVSPYIRNHFIIPLIKHHEKELKKLKGQGD